MKRFVVSAFALSILSVFLLASTVDASENPISPEQAGAGGTISIESLRDIPRNSSGSVDITVRGVPSPGITTYQLELRFDPSVVQIVEIRGGDAPFNNPNLSDSIGNANRQGSISFGQFLSGTSGMTDGVLATVVLLATGRDGSATALDLSMAGNSCKCLTVTDGSFTVEDLDINDDGTPDCAEDNDGDGLPNCDEDNGGTDRDDPDTDDDGLTDGEEILVYQCVDPTRRDTDGDGLADGEEVITGLDPCNPDTDRDEVRDNVDECPLAREDGRMPKPNDGCANAEVGGDPPLYNNIQVFPTPETAMGQDLNNDSQTKDTVLRYRDIVSGEVVNTGHIVSGSHANIDMYGTMIAFVGAGDQIRYYDINSKQVADVGMTGSHPAIYANTIVFESAGSIHTYDIAAKRLNRTNIQGSDPVIYRNTIAFRGGFPSSIRIYMLNTGEVIETGAMGTHPAIFENIVAFTTDEQRHGSDLNGDNAVNNVSVIRYYNTTTRQTISTGAIGDFPMIHQNLIAFATRESIAGEDLSGDGKYLGHVIRYYDLSNNTLYNTGQLGTEPDIFNGKISYYAWENWLNEDINGDGDMNDPVVDVVAASGSTGTTVTPINSTPPSTGFGSVAAFDGDSNGFIDDGEFFGAIDQWVSGSLSNDLFFGVVDAWIGDVRVSSANSTNQSISLNVAQTVSKSKIVFSMDGMAPSKISVNIYSLTGQQIASRSAMGNKLAWNMRDALGQSMANGVYLYVVSAVDSNGVWKSEVQKLAIIR